MKFQGSLMASAAVLALLSSGSVQANDYYVSVFGGLSSPDDDRFAVGPFSTTSNNTATRTTTSLLAPEAFVGINAYLWRVIDGSFVRATYTHTNYRTSIEGFAEEVPDNGFVVGAAFGRNLMDNLRGEVELAYRSFDLGRSHALEAIAGYTKYVSSVTRLGGTIYFYANSNFSTAIKSGYYSSANPYLIEPYRFVGSAQSSSTTLTARAVSDGEVSAFSVMANLWYDFEIEDSPFTVFVGGGLGAANLDLEYRAKVTMPSTTLNSYVLGPFTSTVRANDDDWVFAWQLGAGLGYDLGNGMVLSAQYRYFATGDVDIGNSDVSINSHEAIISLRIPLGN